MSILEIRSFRAADHDIDQYLVVAKVRERMEVNKQVAQKFDGEIFNLRKLKEPEFGKQYQIGITNRFAALENLSDCDGTNRAWENIKENINTSAKESLGLQKLKWHKPCFDKECLGFFRSKEQAKMKWVQDPSQSNIDIIPYPTAFPYGNGMVLHFYRHQESSTTKTVHKVINKGLKAYV